MIVAVELPFEMTFAGRPRLSFSYKADNNSAFFAENSSSVITLLSRSSASLSIVLKMLSDSSESDAALLDFTGAAPVLSGDLPALTGSAELVEEDAKECDQDCELPDGTVSGDRGFPDGVVLGFAALFSPSETTGSAERAIDPRSVPNVILAVPPCCCETPVTV